MNVATADEQRAVLVTGASTGIGRNITERLASERHYVYAGARKAADIAALTAIANVQGIRLDVTIQEEIDAAVAILQKKVAAYMDWSTMPALVCSCRSSK